MPIVRLLAPGAFVGLVFTVMAGCGPTPRSEVKPPAVVDHEDHDHEHEALGPHEGHLLKLGHDAYQAEWLHDDSSGKVTVYLLDGKAKEPVAVSTPKLEITTNLGEKTKTYELPALDPTGDPPMANTFETTDRSLLEALKAVGHGVTARLRAEIEGQPYQAEFEHLHHDQHHH